jgi:hypothetical protein
MLVDDDHKGLFCLWTGKTADQQRNCGLTNTYEAAMPLKVLTIELLLLASLR